MKALRLVLLAQLHPVVVTTALFDEVDGVRIDGALLEAAELVPFEKVEIVDGSTGTRLSCEVRKAKDGSGEVAVCGAAALLIKPGTRITVSSFGWMKEKQALKHEPRLLRLDDENRVVERSED